MSSTGAERPIFIAFWRSGLVLGAGNWGIGAPQADWPRRYRELVFGQGGAQVLGILPYVVGAS